MGGSSYEGSSGLALGINNDLYLTGFFGSSTFDFGNGVQLINNGTQSVYIAKFNTSGDALWANGSVGSGTYMSEGVTIDWDGLPTITGEFSDLNFGFDSTTLTNNGGDDIFFFQFDKENGSVIRSDGIGGSDDDSGSALFAHYENVYITGSFKSNSISFGATTLNNTNTGTNDSFVAKFDYGLIATTENSNLVASHLYPNPSNGIFNLKTTTAKVIQIEVLNALGQRILSQKPTTENIQIDLRNKPNGVYLLKIQTDKGFENKKLILKK